MVFWLLVKSQKKVVFLDITSLNFMKFVFKSVLQIIAAIVVFVLLIVAYHFINHLILESTAKSNMLGPVEVIKRRGSEYRDLNKNQEMDAYEDQSLSPEERADALLSLMNLEEKVGMMMHPFFPMTAEGDIPTGLQAQWYFSPLDNIINKHVRHIAVLDNAADPSIIAKWHNKLQSIAEQSRLGIPISLSTDPRHSPSGLSLASVPNMCFSNWPDQLGFAAIGDPSVVEEFGKVAAQEYRAVGFHTSLGPMADLATEPRWARNKGTFGEDADLSAKLTAAYIKGFQGTEITSTSVTCMTKHFPGGGPQKDGWDAHFKYGKDQDYPGNNFDYHLKPFEAAINAGSVSMMPYYGIGVNQTNENVGFSYNKEIVTDLLKDEMGYKGIVCTDWNIIDPIKALGLTIMPAKDHGVEELSTKEKYKKALDAGVDQFGGEHDPFSIYQLVFEGSVPEEQINKSVKKLLIQKFKLGLFDNPYVDEENAKKVCRSEQFVSAGHQAMLKSVVLLSNKDYNAGKILPIQNKANIYIENINKETAAQYGNVVASIDEADFAIVRTAAPYQAKEGLLESQTHQGDLDFKEPELTDLLNVIQGKPTIVAIYLDRPAVIPEIAENASALLAHFGATDEALLDIIFGKFNPTGKLPIELPSSMKAVRDQYEDVPYDSFEPLFEFGFGLGYEEEVKEEVGILEE